MNGTPTIVIPARSGSKGWPRKNVSLFDHTASIIPSEYRSKVTVTTDDDSIAGLAEQYRFKVIDRPPELARDESDIKSTLRHIVTPDLCEPRETIIMLYLTYPNRTWDEVKTMYNMFVSKSCKSMLCRQPVKTHPCLTMLDNKDGTGTQVFKHNYYQRQQYPECFEISHYICMFRAGELSKLNRNMYNINTQYYNIERVIDVDHESDYKQFLKNHEYKD